MIDWANNRLRNSLGQESNESPIREGEAELLKQIIRAAKECNHAVKLRRLLELIGTVDDNVSYIVFANSKVTADRVFNFLDLRLSEGKTLRHSTTDQYWRQFRSVNRSCVLVCDRDAEEGLNRQKRGTVAIH